LNKNDIGDASICDGEHHRTVGRVAGPFTGYNFDLANGPNDVAGGTERYQRIFGSYHTGICNFAMCDGSVRSLRNTIDAKALGAYASRNGGETIAG